MSAAPAACCKERVPPVGPPTSPPSSRQGGVLARHVSAWMQAGATPWVVNTVREGIRLIWRDRPPKFRPAPHSQSFASPELLAAMQEQVKQGFWRPATPRDNVKYVSRAFTVPKASGKHRLVVDHSALSQYVSAPHFKMMGVRDVLCAMEQGCWAATLDLTNAYGQCPLHPNTAMWLAADVGGKTYIPLGLTQGISLAPFVFTKLVATAWRAIRRTGTTVVGYLDDSCLLFPGATLEQARALLHKAVAIFEGLGYIVNREKSSLEPTRAFNFLGLHFDTSTMTVEWPSAKRLAVREQLRKLLAQRDMQRTTPRQVAHTVGALKAAAAAFPAVHLALFATQRALSTAAARAGWDATFILPQQARTELTALHALLANPVAAAVNVQQTTPATLTTDAAPSVGWGATLEIAGKKFAYGERWPPSLQQRHSTELELHAVASAMAHFAPLLRGTRLKILSDCTAVVYDVKRRRVGSPRLLASARKIVDLCEALQVSLTIEHLAGVLNTESDLLSRTEQHHGLVLRADAFAAIQSRLGPCSIDCFARPSNAKLPRFWSLTPSERAEHHDFFAQSLDPSELYYVFPPPALLLRVLAVIRDSRARAVVVAPDFPEPAWEPLLSRLATRTLRLGAEALVPSRATQELPRALTWTAYLVAPQEHSFVPRERPPHGASTTRSGRSSPDTAKPTGHKPARPPSSSSSASSRTSLRACAPGARSKPSVPRSEKALKSAGMTVACSTPRLSTNSSTAPSAPSRRCPSRPSRSRAPQHSAPQQPPPRRSTSKWQRRCFSSCCWDPGASPTRSPCATTSSTTSTAHSTACSNRRRRAVPSSGASSSQWTMPASTLSAASAPCAASRKSFTQAGCGSTGAANRSQTLKRATWSSATCCTSASIPSGRRTSAGRLARV